MAIRNNDPEHLKICGSSETRRVGLTETNQCFRDCKVYTALGSKPSQN